jgi:SAM-dependent methyltransferase
VSIDRSRRTTFNEEAEAYDEVRPRYPDELVEDVLALSGLPSGGRILEVGCGPGNATLPFARRGYRMLCIELGQWLAALAARNCRPYPGVQVLNASFEEWELDEGAFDLVISAEAFHWIPPQIAYPKAARALKPGGSIALWWIVDHVPDTALFAEIERLYGQWAPRVENPTTSITAEWVVERIVGNLEASGCFGPPTVHQYAWSERYTAEQYVKLLSTFSAHRELSPEARTGLYAAVRRAVERFGGQVIRPCLGVLFHAEVRK